MQIKTDVGLTKGQAPQQVHIPACLRERERERERERAGAGYHHLISTMAGHVVPCLAAAGPK